MAPGFISWNLGRWQGGKGSRFHPNGHVDKRKYRVEDLRKFPTFARIIGYKDDKRFRLTKIVSYNRPKGWIPGYFLDETPVLPSDVEMKLRSNADYFIDNERPVPEALKTPDKSGVVLKNQ